MVVTSRFIELEDGESANGVIAGKNVKLPYTCIEKVAKNAKRIIYDAESKEAAKLIIENNLIDKNCYPWIERFHGTSYTSANGIPADERKLDIELAYDESKALAIIVNAYVKATRGCLASRASATLNKNKAINGIDIITRGNGGATIAFIYNLNCVEITWKIIKELSQRLYDSGYIIIQINRYNILTICRPENTRYNNLTEAAKQVYEVLRVSGTMQVNVDGDIVGCIHE